MATPRTIARLEARIQERAAYCLEFELSDPRTAFITITRVELTPDLVSGKIHYSVLGDEGERSKARHMLKSAAGYIQRQVGRVLQLRRIPRLDWYYDDSLALAARMDDLIRGAIERDEQIHDHGASDEAPEDSDSAGAPGETDETGAPEDTDKSD